MDLEQKLKEAEELVASVRKQIEESKELKPYDWYEEESYGINKQGTVVHFHKSAGAGLFYTKTKEQAEVFAHKLKILSCINNLKQTLGCTHEFTVGDPNYEILFDERHKEWKSFSDCSLNTGSIQFKTKGDADKVVKYLSEHYPNGWRLA